MQAFLKCFEKGMNKKRMDGGKNAGKQVQVWRFAEKFYKISLINWSGLI